MDQFHLDGLEKALGNGSVPTVALTAHAPFDTSVAFQQVDELLASVLDSPVRMEDRPFGRGPVAHGHFPCRYHGIPRAQVGALRPVKMLGLYIVMVNDNN